MGDPEFADRFAVTAASCNVLPGARFALRSQGLVDAVVGWDVCFPFRPAVRSVTFFVTLPRIIRLNMGTVVELDGWFLLL